MNGRRPSFSIAGARSIRRGTSGSLEQKLPDQSHERLETKANSTQLSRSHRVFMDRRTWLPVSGGANGELSPQLTAFFTSAPIPCLVGGGQLGRLHHH